MKVEGWSPWKGGKGGRRRKRRKVEGGLYGSEQVDTGTHLAHTYAHARTRTHARAHTHIHKSPQTSGKGVGGYFA